MKERIPLYIIGAFVFILLISLLTGCRTKTLVEYISVHDTLRISEKDTVLKIKTEFTHDTLRIETEKVVTVNEKGDTVFVALYKDRWRDRVVHQTDTVKEKSTDTIYISRENEHQQVVTKKPSWWSLWKWRIIALLALCAVIILLWRNYKGTIKKWLKR